MNTDLAKLPDTGLDYLERQLLQKIAALRYATNAIGLALLQQYEDKLTQVRLEVQRRRT